MIACNQSFIDGDYSACLTETIPSYTGFASRVTLPDGKQKGNSLRPMPSQRLILAKLDAGYRHIAAAKPVQDGLTTLILVPTLRRTVCEHQTGLLCYPTADSAKAIWTTKGLPVFHAFGGQSPRSGGGSKGGAAAIMKLPGGGMIILRSGGGRGESGQASITGDFLVIDEFDDWPSYRVILNIRKRIKESPDPLEVDLSTIKRDQGSYILKQVALGTDSHMEFPCVRCGAFQALKWENLDLDTCLYKCEHCPHRWSEDDRRASLENMICVDKNPLATCFSVRWSCLDSPLTTMREEVHGTVAASLPGYLSAVRAMEAGDHNEMRSFYRDRLARVYLGDSQEEEGGQQVIDPKALSQRSMAYGWADVVADIHPDKIWSRYLTRAPDGVAGMVKVIDVQSDRLYWSLIGYNLSGTSWDLAWGQERCRMRKVGDTLQPEPWGPGDLMATLDRLRDFIATEANYSAITLRHRIMDTRYEGRELSIWLHQNQEYRACAGVKALPKVDPETQDKRRMIVVPGLLAYDYEWVTGLGRWEIVTEHARKRVHDAYRKSPSEPGAAILPSGLPSNDHYLRHLCAWRMVIDEKTNRMRWKQFQIRDDHLDTRSYGYALILFEVEKELKRQKLLQT